MQKNFSGLSGLGEYILKETKTPAGLAMNHKKYEVVLTKDKKDQVVEVLFQALHKTGYKRKLLSISQTVSAKFLLHFGII